MRKEEGGGEAMKIAVKHWKRTGIVTPKCPKCERGVMHMTDCCYNSDPPEENYVCGTCGYGETYHGIYTLGHGLISALQQLKSEGVNLTKLEVKGAER